ncbi:MAG TPA: peptidoglycan-binding protein [Candidatus Binatia bacterium]|nr:peptidoglycan-binding protein [Candidatus Binatia bacterium]
MTKDGLIIPVCFMVLSGCSVFDHSQMTPETVATSSPVVESESTRPVLEAQPATVKHVPAPAPRSMTGDDIRRLQTRLRELGFNPGPLDGVAGAKTKIAFVRLETACSRLEPLSENLPPSVVEKFGSSSNGGKPPSHADTVILQSQLRSAGFDPGPVDGILGARTKSLVSVLPSSCAMAKEFQGALEQPVHAEHREPGLVRAISLNGPIPSRVTREDNPKPTESTQSKPDEDVRILQLRLRDAGFDPGPFDGIMGAKTKAALEQFEASQRNRKTKVSLTATKVSGQY